MKIPQLLPLPMARYGLNIYGEPLFRVAWSDSRTYLIGTQKGEEFAFSEYPLYDGIHAWVLEKFQSSEEYAGPRDVYDRKEMEALTKLGPYPERGEYVHCYTFPFEPDHSMIDIYVRANKASNNLSRTERKDSIMEPLLARRRRNHNRVDEVFDNAQPAFRYSDAMVSAVSNNGVIRRAPSKRIKDVQFRLGAEDTGLPMSDNAFFTGESDGHTRNLAGAGK